MAARFGVATEIFGDQEIIRIMGKMRTTSGRRTMSAGAWLAADVLLKAAKRAIPSNNKNARKAHGRRRLKVKESPDGGAKVGGRVAASSKVRARGKTPGKKGVGIGARNLHWTHGTGTLGQGSGKERYTGKKGGPVRRTGSSNPTAISMAVLARRNSTLLRSQFARGARKQLDIEVSKGKAF